jgi:hypothetical protein
MYAHIPFRSLGVRILALGSISGVVLGMYPNGLSVAYVPIFWRWCKSAVGIREWAKRTTGKAVERINTQIWTFHYGMAYPEE